jgi:epoxyqueuosine reductase QueG
MIESTEIKNMAAFLGADLCGIASIDRFHNAPKGFHPYNIYKDTKSVIAIACRVPDGPVDASNLIPYFVNEEVVAAKIKKIAFELSLFIEDSGYKAVVIPSFPYDYWDEQNQEGKGILSLKHLAFFAGLGYIGRNSLLCNPEFGNLIKLGAIITNVELKADNIHEGEMCGTDCNLCETNCPVNAICNYQVSQKKCRPNSEIINKRGAEVYTCNMCRKICPNRNGIK